MLVLSYLGNSITFSNFSVRRINTRPHNFTIPRFRFCEIVKSESRNCRKKEVMSNVETQLLFLFLILSRNIFLLLLQFVVQSIYRLSQYRRSCLKTHYFFLSLSLTQFLLHPDQKYKFVLHL